VVHSNRKKHGGWWAKKRGVYCKGKKTKGARKGGHTPKKKACSRRMTLGTKKTAVKGGGDEEKHATKKGKNLGAMGSCKK